MHFIHLPAPAEWLEALGWTIVHASWQIAVLGGMAALVLAWSRHGSARFRFGVLKATVLGILAWSAGTFAAQFSGLGAGAVPASTAPMVGLQPIVTPDGRSGLTSWLSEHLDLLVIFWSIGFGILTLRLLGGVAWLLALRRWGSVAAPAAWQERFARLRNDLDVSDRVRLLSATHISTPMVMGWVRPVVVVPASLWTGLEPRQLEALLRHELIHIARRDHWWNLLLIVTETLFYYHPVLWWLAKSWRTEQENQCDDAVVQSGETPLVYAKALYHLQTIRGQAPALTIPAAGKKNQLLQRIQRILQSPTKRNHPMEKIIITFLIAGSFGLLSFMEDHTESRTDPFAPQVEEVSVLAQKMAEAEERLDAQPVREKDVELRLLRSQKENPFQRDTLPQEFTRVTWKENGKSMKVEVENGRIQYLEVDGKVIPASDYTKYQDEVEELIGKMPPPPPAPPVPPAPGALSAPPAPPAPPVPPAVRYYGLDSLPGLNVERLQKLEMALQERMRTMEAKTRAFEEQMQRLEQEMQRNMIEEERALRETMERMEQKMREQAKNGKNVQLDEELQQELRQKSQKIAEAMQLRAEEMQRKVEKLVKEKEFFEQKELEEIERLLKKVQ